MMTKHEIAAARAAAAEAIRQLEEACEPAKMSPAQAFEFLSEVSDHLCSARDALLEEHPELEDG